MKKRFVVFSIGCLECHMSSYVVGVYKTEEEANRVKEEEEDKHHGDDYDTSREFEVFPIVV